MNPVPRLWRRIVTICVLSVVGACSILPEAQVRDSYRLPVSRLPSPAAQPVPVDGSLQVATPDSGHLLDSQRILVIRHDNQINVYKGAQWSEPAPVLVRDRILDAFRTDGRIKSVTNDATSVTSDIELHSDLRSFQVEYRESRPIVQVQLDASLVATAVRRIVATHSFSIELPAKGEQVPDIVEAFGAATDQLAQKVVDWTLLRAASSWAAAQRHK